MDAQRVHHALESGPRGRPDPTSTPDLSGFAELLIGVKWETLERRDGSAVTDAGAVHVLFGAASGLTATGSRFLHYDNAGAPTPAKDANFGSSITVGDFGGSTYPDGARDPGRRRPPFKDVGERWGSALAAGDYGNSIHEDLAVSAALESFGQNNTEYQGAVHVLYGTTSGLNVTANQYWTQNVTGVAGDAEPADLFGPSLN